jgi:hypothetical protein
MKSLLLKTSLILLSTIFTIGFVLTSCKKTPSAQEQAFLSDPNVVTCTLEKTTISQLNLEKNDWPSFLHRMEEDERKTLMKGQLILADRDFLILLADRPEREFFLYDIDKEFGPYWWGSWSLYSYHKIDEDFYEFMFIEDGNKLAARKYKGDIGVFKAGKGGRELEKVEFSGSLHQKGNVAVPIGNIEKHRIDSVAECVIPTGDYTAYIMHITYDNLNITISNNYHTNAKGQSSNKEIVYGIQVRKNKPYVLDFSNEPMVVFDQPPMSKTIFSRGEEIQFAAVLIDPELDIMIRGLDDTSVKVDREYKDSDGKVIDTLKVSKSLDPNIVITRADGEIVAEGVMPFG